MTREGDKLVCGKCGGWVIPGFVPAALVWGWLW